jgi:subtilisin family serine protease
MKYFIILFSSLMSLLFVPIYAQSGHTTGGYNPQELVCKMQPGYSIDLINAEYGTITKGHQSQTECYLLAVPQHQNAESLAVVINLRPDVVFCELNYYLNVPEGFQKSSPFPDLLLTGDYLNQTAAQTLNLSAIQSTTIGSDVKIALIDGGVCFDHPEFIAIPGALRSMWDYVDNDSIAYDELGGSVSGHGTFVAGVLKLMAPGAQISVYRALDTAGQGTGYNIASAILRSVDEGCKVVNLSLGMTGYDDAIDEALRYARDHNVMVIAAAGNDSTSELSMFPFPASRPYCLAVAALDSLNRKADFSNYGLRVDYCAPGTMIYAPYLNSYYAWWNGTSFSAPFVTGLVALMYSMDSTLTCEKIDTLLSASAVSVDSLNPGLEGLLGHGLINPLLVVQSLGTHKIGDTNTDGLINVGDAIYLVNYIFKGGLPPQAYITGDPNCDGRINVGDVVYLIKFIFNAGSEPCQP